MTKGARSASFMLALTTCVAGILIVTAGAAAQSSAVDQYVPSQKPRGTESAPDPVFSSAGDSGGGTETEPAAQEGGGERPPVDAGAGSGGELPGTDYPLTGTIAIVLALLVGALVLRALWPLISGRSGRGGSAGRSRREGAT
jgi:hypothetical protein